MRQESLPPGVPLRINVKRQAANVTQELAADEPKIVMVAIKSARVQKYCAGERFLLIVRRIQPRNRMGGIPDNSTRKRRLRKQGSDYHVALEVQPAQKVFVVRRYRTEIFIRPDVLNVGFDARTVSTDAFPELLFTSKNALECGREFRGLRVPGGAVLGCSRELRLN